MYPYEFQILWALKWGGDHPRSAADILGLARTRYRDTPQALAPTLRSMAGRDLLAYDRDTRRWALTDFARKVLAA